MHATDAAVTRDGMCVVTAGGHLPSLLPPSLHSLKLNGCPRSPYPHATGDADGAVESSQRRQSAFDAPLILPSSISRDAADLIIRLLTRRPELRLGSAFGDFKVLMVRSRRHAVLPCALSRTHRAIEALVTHFYCCGGLEECPHVCAYRAPLGDSWQASRNIPLSSYCARWNASDTRGSSPLTGTCSC